MSLRWMQDVVTLKSSAFKALDLSRDNKLPDLFDQAFIAKMIMRKHLYFPEFCSEPAYLILDYMIQRVEYGLN